MRKLYVLLVLSLLSIGSWAQTISEQEALNRALQFLNSQTHAGQKKAPAKKSQMKAARLNVDGIYAFNREGGGFVIASADERALPVLGYSDKGAIDWQQMPDNMRAWLTSYSQAINELGDGCSVTGVDEQPTNTGKAAIEPLLKTTWNQDKPYWDKAPLDPNRHLPSLTGCVATAMAQVMNYHQWPKAACTAIPAYDVGFEPNIQHYDELPATTIDWDNMLADYEKMSYTDAQADAVATLMRYCGQSVQMLYSSGLSSTGGGLMADALRLYFDYDPNVYYATRTYYGIDEWEDLIYNELATNGPVPYCGQTDAGGHSFVCDGYDGNGLFHINWGWGGDADGYFSLSVLNPQRNSGAGASSSTMGYCMFQEAIIGVKPSTGGTPEYPSRLILFGNIALDGNKVKYAGHYDNLVYPKATFEAALGTMDGDGKLTPVVKAAQTYTVEMRFNANVEIDLNNAGLAPGTYHLMPMARCVATGDEPAEGPWHLLSMPERKVQVVVNGDGVTCSLEYVPDIDIEKAYVSNGTLVANEPNDVTLEIKNKGHEYSGEVVVRTWFMGDKTSQEAIADLPAVSELKAGTRTGAYLRQNGTGSLVIPIKEKDKGNYLMLLYEANTEELLDTATIALNKDFEHEFINLEVVAYKFEYKLIPDDIDVLNYEVTLKNNDAKYNWPKYENEKDQLAESVYIQDQSLANTGDLGFTIAKGQERFHNNSTWVLFDEYDGPCTYTLTEVLYDGQKKEIFKIDVQPGETLVYPTPTGINAVTTEQSAGKIYDLQGRQLKGNPTQRGIYIVNGKKVVK